MSITFTIIFFAGWKSGVFVRLQDAIGPLIDVGGCSLHYVHNATRHATEAIDAIGVEKLLSEIYNFFRYPVDQHEYALVRIVFLCL